MMGWFMSLLGVSRAFQLSNTLGSHMVLQRDVPANVWGFATPHTQVQVGFGKDTFTVLTDDSGVWRLALPATKAGGPYTISFTSSEGNAVLEDVLFGDVYLCGGQSNMQFTPLSGLNNATAEIQAADKYPNIRLFTVGQGTQSDTPLQQLKTIEQQWIAASAAQVGGPGWGYFSAVCWLFGRQIFDELGGAVPIGLISNNWGGTAVQQWSSPEALQACSKTGSGNLWNAMIVPYTVGPFTVTGATWYQGEANVGEPAYYSCAFPAMISDWRKKLNNDKMFFGFVHLAGYNYGDGPYAGDLRQAQLAALSLPNVGYSTGADVGLAFDIHPTDKQTVAKRLANSALAIVYGKSRAYKSPIYASSSVSIVGNNITVRVDFQPGTVGRGLTAAVPDYAKVVKADQCTELGLNVTECGFPTIQVNDAKSTVLRASASISSDGQALVLSVVSPAAGLTAVTTSYGRAGWPVTTFFNSDGQPVLGWYAPVGKVASPLTVLLRDNIAANEVKSFDGSMDSYAKH